MISVLFTCLGNICRSPACEAIFRYQARQWEVDDKLEISSCGIGHWHAGQPPHHSMVDVLRKKYAIFMDHIRAKPFDKNFFSQFDYILIADRYVMHELYLLTDEKQHKDKIHLINRFNAHHPDENVPSPYFEGEAGYEKVADMLMESCQQWLHHFFPKTVPSWQENH